MEPIEKANKTVGMILILNEASKNAVKNNPSLPIKMGFGPEKKNFSRFYKVYKNETAVVEVNVNDFKPFWATYQKIKTACSLNGLGKAFSLPADEFMYCGFLSRIKAMKYAKTMALKYISKLIKDGEKSYCMLLKYREDHYEDLNVNLVDRNIRKFDLALIS